MHRKNLQLLLFLRHIQNIQAQNIKNIFHFYTHDNEKKNVKLFLAVLKIYSRSKTGSHDTQPVLKTTIIKEIF